MNILNSPSICIIVPTLNSYRLLSNLVESLLSQTSPHWSVLFVDGDSNNEHREWLLNCCNLDSRFTLTTQPSYQPGIFGAMNHGFSLTSQYEWVLFWGSDDLAFDSFTIERIINDLSLFNHKQPDLVFYSGCYFDPVTRHIHRRSSFIPEGSLSAFFFRISLFLGFSPVHQATLFGVGARSLLSSYNLDFYLASDLNYFLSISTFPSLRIFSSQFPIVSMSSAGVSGKYTFRRLSEVIKAYWSSFGILSFCPFFLRYIIRLLSKLFAKRTYL